MDPLVLLGSAIWFILPAYVANGAPVVFGGGRPIDGGREFFDGRPIFGEGKTVRGFLAGLGAGSVVGTVQTIIASQPWTYVIVGILLAAGALTGDLLGSFFKRRLGIPRGGIGPGVDQLGFVLVAMLFASPLAFPAPDVFVTIILVTPFIHIGANYGGYKLGLKARPY